MFNDERINYEMARLKRFIIILCACLGSVFLIYKSAVNTVRDLKFTLYSTELIIVAASVAVLVGALFVRSEVRDELYYQRKARYFDIAFKILLYVVLISYAVVIPSTIASGDNALLSSNTVINFIMLSSLFFGYGYLRLKGIYFNYSFIEEETRDYYKKVFKNILKIAKFFAVIYLVALSVALFYMLDGEPLKYFISILASFIYTVISNSLYYLFISAMERLFIKEEEKRRITSPTLILFAIATVCLLAGGISHGIYYFLSMGKLTSFTLEQLRFLMNLENVLYEYFRFFSVLALTFLTYDISKRNNGMRKLSPMLISFIVLTLGKTIWERIRNVVITVLEDHYFSLGNVGIHTRLYQALTKIDLASQIIEAVYFMVISVLLLTLFRREMNKLCGLRILLIILAVLLPLPVICTALENFALTAVAEFFRTLVLPVCFFVYLFVNFKNDKNSLKEEQKC